MQDSVDFGESNVGELQQLFSRRSVDGCGEDDMDLERLMNGPFLHEDLNSSKLIKLEDKLEASPDDKVMDLNSTVTDNRRSSKKRALEDPSSSTKREVSIGEDSYLNCSSLFHTLRSPGASSSEDGSSVDDGSDMNSFRARTSSLGIADGAVESCDPPRSALSSDLALLHFPRMSENESLRIHAQPPLEIRTRTKNENRIFAISVQVFQKSAEGRTAHVEMCYATDTSTFIDTLGGTLTRPVTDGMLFFDDLSVSVASPKHSEKEFCLCVTLDLGDGKQARVYSTPFYAFSHKTVLKRRREVTLRALSHATISKEDAAQTLHVVGAPFVRSDRLQCVFRVKSSDMDRSSHIKREDGAEHEEWMSLQATQLELFSESALFFQLPAELCNLPYAVNAYVQVTNDGRNFSNPLSVRVLAQAVSADRTSANKRHCFRARM